MAPTFTTAVTHTVLTFTLVVTDEHGLASSPDEVVVTVSAQQLYLPMMMRGATATAEVAVLPSDPDRLRGH